MDKPTMIKDCASKTFTKSELEARLGCEVSTDMLMAVNMIANQQLGDLLKINQLVPKGLIDKIENAGWKYNGSSYKETLDENGIHRGYFKLSMFDSAGSEFAINICINFPDTFPRLVEDEVDRLLKIHPN